MSEFYRYQDKEFPELRECINYVSDNASNDSDRSNFTVQRVLVTNEDQWGSYSETVQELQFGFKEPAL